VNFGRFFLTSPAASIKFSDATYYFGATYRCGQKLFFSPIMWLFSKENLIERIILFFLTSPAASTGFSYATYHFGATYRCGSCTLSYQPLSMHHPLYAIPSFVSGQAMRDFMMARRAGGTVLPPSSYIPLR
jgi:hypothetical protein